MRGWSATPCGSARTIAGLVAVATTLGASAACGLGAIGGAPADETPAPAPREAADADASVIDDGAAPVPDPDSASPACLASPPGLLGWWTGDGTMEDHVGSNHGTSGTQGSGGVTAVTFAAGMVDKAFDLAGKKYVQIANAPAIRPSAAITMEAWVNAPSFGGRIVDKITAGTSDGYMLDTYQSKLRIIIGNATVSSPATLPTNTWVHVAGTWDGATARVYVDAMEVASVPATTLPTNSLSLRIGADSTGNTRFAGKIDEVGLWGRALDATELAAIVASGSRGRCKL